MARKLPEPDENGEYTEKQIKRLKQYAWNSSLWHLQRTSYTVRQITDKLKRKKLPEFVITHTVELLIKEGYLNDVSYAENFVYSKRKYEKLGVNSIRSKLMQKGISSDIIAEAVSEIDEDDLEETATILAEKKIQSTPYRKEPDKQKKIQKLVSFLAYRGYSGHIAYKVAQNTVENFEE